MGQIMANMLRGIWTIDINDYFFSNSVLKDLFIFASKHSVFIADVIIIMPT